MESSTNQDVYRSIVTVVAMICATAIVLVAMQSGYCDDTTIILALLLLFGGEQVAKAWIKASVTAGDTNMIPSVLLRWYNATESNINGIVE